MKILDNVLDQNVFNKLQDFMMGSDFAWYYNPYIVSDIEPEKEFQFTHTFYIHNNLHLDELMFFYQPLL